MLITPDVIDRRYTQQQIDDMINNLLLDVYEFSSIACIDGFAYGVRDICDTCTIRFNWCLRKSLIKQLVEQHRYVEDKLKYRITPGYHSEKLEWNGGTRFTLKNPGVAELLIQQTITKVPDVTGTVGPYVYTTTAEVGGFTLVPLDLVDDPEAAIYRNANDARVFIDSSNPFELDVGGDNWKIWLEGIVAGNEVNVQSCKYIIVDVDLTSVTSGEIRPVYTGSMQYIPVAKPPEELEGDPVLTRFWFSPYVLTNHAFRTNGVNLLNGEFYKLVKDIEFVTVVESAAPLIVEYYDCPCLDCPTTTSSETSEITVEIVDGRRGIISVNACEFSDCNCKQIVSVTVKYRTDPELVNPGSSEMIKDAIANLVAAELPLVACGCIQVPDQSNLNREFNYGFIGAAQHAYTEIRINQLTGENVENWKHGNLHGQVVFVEKMSRVKTYKRTIIK